MPTWATVMKDFILMMIGGFILIAEELKQEPRLVMLGVGTALVGLPIGQATNMLRRLLTASQLQQEVQSSSSQSGQSTTGGL